MNENIVDVSAEQFAAEVLDKSAEMPVLVDFWADWCQPCRALTPILEGLVEKLKGRFRLVKVNVDAEQMLAGQLGIQSLPTVVLFSGGQPVDSFVGVQPAGEIEAMLQPHLGPETEEASESAMPQAPEVARALALYQAGETAQALELLQGIDEDTARLTAVEICLRAGDAAQARALSKAWPEALQARSEAVQLLARVQLAELAEPADEALKSVLEQVQTAEGLEAGMHRLLQLLQAQPADTAVRQALIAAFDLFEDRAQASHYRREMARVLF